TSKTSPQARFREEWVASVEIRDRAGEGEGDPHHFESICLDAEVGVVLVALDHTGLDSAPPTLDEDLRTIHREQLHLLHFSDSPEEDLRRGPAGLLPTGPGRGQQTYSSWQQQMWLSQL
uniref:Uncharacterized protein n=1 Tax=Sus scrofa TaxID=9823 RepID=A0A8D0XJ85_PIG